MPETFTVSITTYSLEELKDGVHIPDDDAVPGSIARAYDRALDKMRDIQFDYDWWDTALDQVNDVLAACGFECDARSIEFDIDRRSQFLLPRGTRIDEEKFLRALKIYLSGRDVRVPLLGYGKTPENEKRAIKAIGSQIRTLDLRSKDARIVRERGLALRTRSVWDGRDEFSTDFGYEGLSDRFKEDANEFLSDLCHYGLTYLRDEQEYLGSEEALLGLADANDYRFTETGEVYA